MRITSIILVAAFAVCVPDEGYTEEWLIQGIDCPKLFSTMRDRHLRLDLSLHPHMVYGRDHLYHAWFDGTAWNYETVDSQDIAGFYASLDIDGDGNLHVSYAIGVGGSLQYAINDGAGWTHETVDGVVGYHTTIAVTSTGMPCISYYDSQNDNLRYAQRGTSGWIIDIVDTEGDVGMGSSLVLDEEDNPHVSYCDYWNHRVKYACDDGSGWTIQIADTGDDFPEATSLARGSDGSIHIAFLARFSLEPDACVLKYAFRPGQADPWQTEDLGFVADEAASASIALDQSGIPHIAFQAAGDLKLAYRDEAGWHIEALYAPGYGGAYPSLVIEGSTLHASFYEVNLDALCYARKSGESTSVELVDVEGSAGRGNSIALSSADWPSISYYRDELFDRLTYAWEDQAGWHTEMVDSAGMCGVISSLAMDAADHAHIAYNEGIQDDLRYARRDETGWIIITVDTEGNVGHWPSLALDMDGFPHISYADWTSGQTMKYAHEDNAGWHVETFDDDWMVGGRNTIAVDSNRNPHVVYVPFPTVEVLKYGWKDRGIWHIEVITPGEFEYASIALDDDDEPHVCYTAWENDGLIYARRINRVWYHELVEEGVYMLSFPSIALDIAGFPHISYYRTGPYGDLRYAYKDALGWHLTTADPSGHSIWETDLALDGAGIPHMSYFKSTTEDLVYVRMVQPQQLMINWILLGESIHFSWTPLPQASEYWVYGTANHPHFVPGTTPGYEYRLDVLYPGTTSWITTDAPGNPDENWTYLIMAVDGAGDELLHSVRVGEFDHETDIP